MPKFHTEAFKQLGDQRWLRSNHGLWNAQTYTAIKNDWTAVITAEERNGLIPSGYPVVFDGGKAKPYTGTGTPAGHILTDISLTYGDMSVPVLTHGIVDTRYVPFQTGRAFTKPANSPYIEYLP